MKELQSDFDMLMKSLPNKKDQYMERFLKIYEWNRWRKNESNSRES